MPDLPADWNWGDLPVRLTASESISYNSNVTALPGGVNATNGRPQGDFYSQSSFGVSTRTTWSGQQFFFDGNFGVLRYLHQTSFDSNVYSFNPGVNWHLTSRCSGTLIGFFTRSPSTLNQLVGVGINYQTVTSANETGKCAISNGFSVLFNSGVTETTNSNPLDAVNNSHSKMISAGIEYARGDDSLSLIAAKTDTSYSNRGFALNNIGLANTLFTIASTRAIRGTFSPKLSVTGQVGLVGVTNVFTFGLPKTLLPTYSLSAAWTVTPKVSLVASASRTVTPPTTVIANAETAYLATLSLTYRATPKVAFSATASAGYKSAAFTPGLVGTTFAPFLANTNYYSVTAGVTYAMTPFISAALNASYSERVSEHVITPQDLITVSLNYKPY